MTKKIQVESNESESSQVDRFVGPSFSLTFLASRLFFSSCAVFAIASWRRRDVAIPSLMACGQQRISKMPPPSQMLIDAPLSLGNFFPAESDEEDGEVAQELDNCYEVQLVTLAGVSGLQVRQYAYHSHNANRVWPGTFNLADYLLEKMPNGKYAHQWNSVLELGTACGLLSIRLAKSMSSTHTHLIKEEEKEIEGNDDDTCASFCCTSIVTSDVDDEGDILDNVTYNFQLNGMEQDQPPHVPHTWGTGWKQSASILGLETKTFDTIVASDILLYVSAYGALVKTITELMPVSGNTKFVISWNRRMKESAEFFDRMKDAGFDWEHLGKCVYLFVRRKENPS
jgi:hypothetical protein